MIITTFPIYIKNGWIQVTLYPEKKFDTPDAFQEMTDPEELSSCWSTVKEIVDRVVHHQIERSRYVVQQNAKIYTVVDIYNSLAKKEPVDEKILLKEVLKTGRFSEEEANYLIKKVREEKIEGGMAWY